MDADEANYLKLLHEAEQEGYGLLASLREGDKFRSLGEWFTVVKIQNDFSERKLGETHKDRTAWFHCTDETGAKRYLRRPIFQMAPVEYTDEHAAELFGEQQAPGGIMF